MSVEIGSPAPDFQLNDQHGTPVALSALRGRRVVLIFYPLAFSRVCHGELSAVRDELMPGLPDDVTVLAVSVDSFFSLRAWAEEQGFTFSLLSDFWPHGKVAQAYGVFDEEHGTALRGTFIIDGEGVVRWKIVNPRPAARDVADYVKALADIS